MISSATLGKLIIYWFMHMGMHISRLTYMQAKSWNGGRFFKKNVKEKPNFLAIFQFLPN